MKDVIKELHTEFNAYGETLLAHEISKKSFQLKSVHKVSQAILNFFLTNQDTLTQVLEKSSHTQSELLSEKIHGHLTLPDNKRADGKNILDLLINTLSNKNSDLSKLMQIHSFFIQRLYDHCPNKDDNQKNLLVKQIFYNDLFANRKREKIDTRKENLSPGVISNSTLAQQLANIGIHKPTSAPKDLYVLSDGSSFLKEAQRHNLPVACDVSGHTGSLLLGATLYGDLSKTELHEYLIAAFSYLTLARAHTFHEVMIVGQTVGLPFSFNTYNELLPESIRSLSTFTK